MPKIQINGKQTDIGAALSIADLVSMRGLSAKKIVIEYNKRIVEQKDWPECVLREGDELEIVSFVGGG